MQVWVIRNNETKKFVAPAGSHHSYTSQLENARKYLSREKAEQDRCIGNETVYRLDQVPSSKE